MQFISSSLDNCKCFCFVFFLKKIAKVNLCAFIYILFHDFSSVIDLGEVFMKQSVKNAHKITSEIFVHEALD